MGGILGGISAILSGGVTGLLGVVFQRFADYKNKQLDMQLEKQRGDIELQKMEKESEIRKAEAQARVEVAVKEGEAAKDVAESQAFAASFGMEPQRYAQGTAPAGRVGEWGWLLLTLVDSLRGAIRPLLTLYLCVIATYLYWDAHSLIGDAKYYTADQALALVTGIIDTILYLWVTCTTWWFGTRNKQEPPKGVRI